MAGNGRRRIVAGCSLVCVCVCVHARRLACLSACVLSAYVFAHCIVAFERARVRAFDL